MNTIEVKAELWDLCINQGIFNVVSKENASRIQSIFETTISIYIPREDNIEILKKEFIIKIKEELNKLNSFEEKQKEYNLLLSNKPPVKIDFSDKIDEPIKNIDELVEKTQNNRQEVFKQFEALPVNNKMNEINNDGSKEINWSKVIKSQNDILIKILETQQKILVLLQK